MGYAHYVLPDGREAGYAVTDTCNREGCSKEIDRGMDFLCGENPGSPGDGCGGYFCADHLLVGFENGARCEACAALIDRDEPCEFCGDGPCPNGCDEEGAS